MELVIIQEVPEICVECKYENGLINMVCDMTTYLDIQQAVRALNKSRQSQREFKRKESGKVNKARKPNITFKLVE